MERLQVGTDICIHIQGDGTVKLFH